MACQVAKEPNIDSHLDSGNLCEIVPGLSEIVPGLNEIVPESGTPSPVYAELTPAAPNLELFDARDADHVPLNAAHLMDILASGCLDDDNDNNDDDVENDDDVQSCEFAEYLLNSSWDDDYENFKEPQPQVNENFQNGFSNDQILVPYNGSPASHGIISAPSCPYVSFGDHAHSQGMQQSWLEFILYVSLNVKLYLLFLITN